MPVPSNWRWLFEDPETNVADYRVPINPNRMSSPYEKKNIDTLRGPQGRLRTRHAPTAPFQWSFSGVIRTQAHHDALVIWANIPNPVNVTDHLGRVWNIVPVRFNATEKRPSARIPEKYDYEFTALMLGRVP